MLKRLSLPPHISRAIDKYFAYAMPLVVGALLIGLALPRVVTEIRVVPADGVLEKLRLTPVEELDSVKNKNTFEKAVESLESAANVHDGNSDLFTDIAFAQLRQVDAVGLDTAEGKVLLLEAIGNLEESLRRNPANSFAWARLSSALLYKEGKVTSDVLEALRWSYRTGPLVEKLTYFRTDLGIRLYKYLDFDLKQSLRGEIAFFFEINWAARLELMALVCKHEAAFIVQNAISHVLEPEELDSYYRDFMSPVACANRNRKNKN